MDSSIVRTHQHAAGARTADPDDTGGSTESHAIGRSRGGRTTGNINDTTELEAVLSGIRVPQPVGRPRTTPDRVIADKGYGSRGNRQLLSTRGIRVTIPEGSDQIASRQRRGSAGGRPYKFDAEVYKDRNVVERCFSWIKHWRAIATRYDKKATNYLGALTAAVCGRPRGCSRTERRDAPRTQWCARRTGEPDVLSRTRARRRRRR